MLYTFCNPMTIWRVVAHYSDSGRPLHQSFSIPRLFCKIWLRCVSRGGEEGLVWETRSHILSLSVCLPPIRKVSGMLLSTKWGNPREQYEEIRQLTELDQPTTSTESNPSPNWAATDTKAGRLKLFIQRIYASNGEHRLPDPCNALDDLQAVVVI